ncbi:hypothetical protein ACFQV2_34470 [Actinokineospora soli]|uniref:Uncharacterized protein n=1 Tax=Actinokineospora soli TaxID=1048753 RepID=A0ABW2TV57_9PSEU
MILIAALGAGLVVPVASAEPVVPDAGSRAPGKRLEQVPDDPNDPERRAGVESAPLDSAHTAAVAEAARTGKPVRVAGLTSETVDVVAQPNGRIVYTATVLPTRTDKSGAWQDFDTTLERKPDGSVRPRVTLADIALSGGGAKQKMAVVGHAGTEVGLSWPWSLPVPELAGDTATYAEVLPGVDLKIKVDGLGFSQVLVVKTPEAAANPKLRSLQFGTHTKGARVTEKEHPLARAANRRSGAVPSTLEVVDESGAVAFTGNASRMWDSAGRGDAADRVVAPVEDDREAVMDVRVGDAQVAISPDQEFLADPKTVYPVYIDPSVSCTCGLSNRVVLYKKDGAVGDTEWNDTSLKAGYVWDTNQSAWITARSYFTFDITSVPKTAAIHWAKLYLTVAHSAADCPGRTNVHITNSISSGIQFGSEPARSVRVGVVGEYTGCPGEGGWSTPGTETNRGDALSTFIRDNRETGIGNTMTFGLFAESETVDTHWRKFKTNPGLKIEYNSAPHRPTTLNLYNGTAPLGCVADANARYVGAGSLTLRAKLTDPDPGSWVRGEFVVYRNYVRQGILTSASQPSGGPTRSRCPQRGSATAASSRGGSRRGTGRTRTPCPPRGRGPRPTSTTTAGSPWTPRRRTSPAWSRSTGSTSPGPATSRTAAASASPGGSSSPPAPSRA